MSKNYYDILGVDKKASKDEIKKAFRKLAHQYHPDKKGGDANKFKEVNEAYTVLSDDKKRAQYDTYGQTFGGGTPGGQGDPWNDFDFSQFTNGGFGGFSADGFDLGDIFGEFFGSKQRPKTKRGRDISIDIELSFEESIFGVERKILLSKISRCETCSGTGAKRNTEMMECKTCNGNGKIREMKRSIFGTIEVSKTCEICSGSGEIPKEKCDTCNGLGILKKQEEINIKIPSGIENGEMIRLSGAGEAVRAGISGDLYIKVHVKNHKVFRKKGNDLVMNLDVKLSDAILGNEYEIETLDGKSKLKIPEGTNTGDILIIKGKGVPSGNKRGDILINTKVLIPKKLNKQSKELLEKMRELGL